MKLLIVYASSEGQTRKIARTIMDRIADSGQSVELLPVSDAVGTDFSRFDRMIIAAPIHAGHYPRALVDFLSQEAENLRTLPTLFLSVSLAAAGHDAEEWRDLDHIEADFCAATGWHPGRVEQIAGAYKPSQYDVFRRYIMRRILAAKDPGADLDADKEYTDWPALAALVDDWLAAADQ
ncbi:Protoporphyrinogen IX dehydrogenase [menaquinone] [Thalassovita gelatinovora]|uniref:Protoporphyrinogen IX dehydrogenase [menaquinone] n=1 Tax=Thalassovita gelatinovora TaxID=53501 RepID=A0A0P1F857_THAGE|nr:flavodoxin domain-containing protein [Thalassovita gelatinovora]QIZ80280.1 protoporphyrinogen oxidase [Thalassovita gelatinovora]CUH64165.1 Protoporphyrinogen IX dehydrogenase [menaquinone] [Thalassovita gelatinovora]SEQ84729.1 menaquinone-dependent protoporphyrinogen oxidase [Thalassovita gelatinovora]